MRGSERAVASSHLGRWWAVSAAAASPALIAAAELVLAAAVVPAHLAVARSKAAAPLPCNAHFQWNTGNISIQGHGRSAQARW